MKVRVSFTLDVDPAAWEVNYGIPQTDQAAIRQDVRTYAENGIRDHLAELGLLEGLTV